MELSNLTGLEKPLQKLVETVGGGIGVVGNAIFEFDAKKIKRVSEAEAEAEKLKLIKKSEGQAESLLILERAQKRLLLEQYNKQVNLENVLYKTKNELQGQDVSNLPVSRDWTSRFLEVAQSISDEAIQDILAKIFAGEIMKPDTYRRRVLDILGNLSSEELNNFKKLATYATKEGYILTGERYYSSAIKYFGLDFSEYLDLCEAGLVIESDSLSYRFDGNDEVGIGNKTFRVIVSEGQVSAAIIKLTGSGRYIANIINRDAVNNTRQRKYVEELTAHLKLNGAEVRIIK